METVTFYILLAFIVLIFLYVYRCTSAEQFIIPQNIVDPGDLDFGIEPPGAIADQGSFTTDMQKYMTGAGEGPI